MKERALASPQRRLNCRNKSVATAVAGIAANGDAERRRSTVFSLIALFVASYILVLWNESFAVRDQPAAPPRSKSTAAATLAAVDAMHAVHSEMTRTLLSGADDGKCYDVLRRRRWNMHEELQQKPRSNCDGGDDDDNDDDARRATAAAALRHSALARVAVHMLQSRNVTAELLFPSQEIEESVKSDSSSLVDGVFSVRFGVRRAHYAAFAGGVLDRECDSSDAHAGTGQRANAMVDNDADGISGNFISNASAEVWPAYGNSNVLQWLRALVDAVRRAPHARLIVLALNGNDARSLAALDVHTIASLYVSALEHCGVVFVVRNNVECEVPLEGSLRRTLRAAALCPHLLDRHTWHSNTTASVVAARDCEQRVRLSERLCVPRVRAVALLRTPFVQWFVEHALDTVMNCDAVHDDTDAETVLTALAMAHELGVAQDAALRSASAALGGGGGGSGDTTAAAWRTRRLPSLFACVLPTVNAPNATISASQSIRSVMQAGSDEAPHVASVERTTGSAHGSNVRDGRPRTAARTDTLAFGSQWAHRANSIKAKVHLLLYSSHPPYSFTSNQLAATAKEAGFDAVHKFSREDLCALYPQCCTWDKRDYICGFAFKSFLALKMMSRIDENDIVFYVDSSRWFQHGFNTSAGVNVRPLAAWFESNLSILGGVVPGTAVDATNAQVCHADQSRKRYWLAHVAEHGLSYRAVSQDLLRTAALRMRLCDDAATVLTNATLQQEACLHRYLTLPHIQAAYMLFAKTRAAERFFTRVFDALNNRQILQYACQSDQTIMTFLAFYFDLPFFRYQPDLRKMQAIREAGHKMDAPSMLKDPNDLFLRAIDDNQSTQLSVHWFEGAK